MCTKGKSLAFSNTWNTCHTQWSSMTWKWPFAAKWKIGLNSKNSAQMSIKIPNRATWKISAWQVGKWLPSSMKGTRQVITRKSLSCAREKQRSGSTGRKRWPRRRKWTEGMTLSARGTSNHSCTLIEKEWMALVADLNATWLSPSLI